MKSVFQETADEMIAAAVANPLDLHKMAKMLSELKEFPKDLTRILSLNGIRYDVRYTHDYMPSDRNKMMCHLSFLREDNVTPTDEERAHFQRAFFGRESKISPNSNMILVGFGELKDDEVLLIQGLNSSRVQMGKIINAPK